MNESMPSMVHPPHAAQKLRTWFCVNRGLPVAGLTATAFTCEVSTETLFTTSSFHRGVYPAPALIEAPVLIAPFIRNE